MLREAVRQVGTVWLGFRPPAVTESLRAALKDSAAGFVPSPGLNANRGSAGGCQGHLWTAVIVEFCHPGSAHHSAVRVCLSVTLSVPETPDVALWTSEDIMAFKYKDNFKQQHEKKLFFQSYRWQHISIEASLGVGLAVVPGLSLRRRDLWRLGALALVMWVRHRRVVVLLMVVRSDALRLVAGLVALAFFLLLGLPLLF